MRIGVEGSAKPLELAGDDAVRPFAVEALDVRGRAVQLGPALDEILSRHDYPPAVSRVLAEAVVMTVLLGSLLRTEGGKLIFQTQTDGAVDLVVVDYRAGGAIRGYARFDADRVAEAVAAGRAGVAALLGKGTLAMTIDGAASGGSRYQGVVPLDGNDLEEAAHTYFRQSEQIPTSVRLAVAEMQTRAAGKVRSNWRAGGVIVQFLPDALERMRQPDLPGGDAPAGIKVPKQTVVEDDAWREARAYVETIEDDELIDPAVPVERLLYRLFHERGVRVYRPAPVRSQCSCSREKVANVLRTFSRGEIEDSTEDGAINVTCEFCGTKYDFDPTEFVQ